MPPKRKPNFPPNYSLANAMVDILHDMGGTGFSKNLYWEARGYPKPPQWRSNRAMRYLEMRGQIKLAEKDNKLFIKLTRKGKVQALLRKLNRDFQKTLHWDGKWRMIIWDIPEASNHQRDKIRRVIKSLGCYRLQQSVFITPYPLPASAVEYLKESGLLKFIRFIRADKIDDDQILKKHFDL